MGGLLRNLVPLRSSREFARISRRLLPVLAICGCLQPCWSQASSDAASVTPAVFITRATVPAKPPLESELIYEAAASYGHYKIFASGSGDFLYTAGMEYDLNCWGRLLGARFDYAGEILPLVLLKQGNKPDIWGTPQAPGYHMVSGLAVSPIGFRLLWRDGKEWMPYLEGKYGMIGFTEKALSNRATYENFSMQSALGVKLALRSRYDLRLGLFSDFHFSDAFIVPVNPGLDVMNANLGLVYHLRGARAPR
ncbi:hypothetical protein DYQ86_03665 [Acidobacteria bacterium AB60]|nr:hypothetical protein DYQ86_03665 [Acidobacteria bacterium AB60]